MQTLINAAIDIVAEEIRNSTDPIYLRKCAEAAAKLFEILKINE